MKWTLIVVGLAGLVVASSTTQREDSPPPAGGTPDVPELSSACATGCAALPPDEDILEQSEFQRLIDELPLGDFDGDNLALETLLFHGARTLELLAQEDADRMDSWLRARLEGELARDHAQLEVRVVDEFGSTRMRLDSIAVPLGEKQHLHADQALGFEAPEVSGTVKRVGLRHLWARL